MTFDSASEKRQYVNRMFARIAHRYDLMNRMMTGGQDVRWRRLMVREAALPLDGRFLDVATGTGDVAFEALSQKPGLSLVVGIDFTLPMMYVGQTRAAGRPVRWAGADTLCLPFPDDTFDAVASGFLMRNVTDVAAALAEQRRVICPGGRVLVLDVPRPPDSPWGRLFRFYFHQIVPRIGGLISGQLDAYAYLPRSADSFMRPNELATVMNEVGLRDVRYQMLMLGTVALHVGVK
jgi:demethylmenaquinone methyltransferase/2-methoxy-6-polyprenyl-1,4-benzoquinol methylase